MNHNFGDFIIVKYVWQLSYSIFIFLFRFFFSLLLIGLLHHWAFTSCAQISMCVVYFALAKVYRPNLAKVSVSEGIRRETKLIHIRFYIKTKYFHDDIKMNCPIQKLFESNMIQSTGRIWYKFELKIGEVVLYIVPVSFILIGIWFLNSYFEVWNIYLI